MDTAILDQSNSSSKSTPKEILFKFLAYLPLFIVSLLLFVGAGVFYIRYQTNLYRATALVLVKGDDKSSSRSGSGNDVIENAMYGGQRVNMDNEIELMRSRSMIKRVVLKNGFNIDYYFKGQIKVTNLYTDAPFSLIPLSIRDSNLSLNIYVSNLNAKGGSYSLNQKDKGKPFSWDQPVNVNGFSLLLKKRMEKQEIASIFNIIWTPVDRVVGGLLSRLTVAPLSSKTTIIQLGITLDNRKKAEDFLNALVSEYSARGIEQKNRVSENTIQFINDRLTLVTRELSGVEGNLQSYRGSNQVIDVEKQSTMFFENTNNLQNTNQQLSIQLRVVQMLVDYVSNRQNYNKTIPSNLSVQDGALTALITKYNELQLQKVRETPLVTGNSLVLEDLNNQLEAARKSIVDNLNNLVRNYQIQINDLNSRTRQNQAFLSSLPRKERGLQEIKRQQGVQEGLYLYLLQKREETAISSASTISNYTQVDPAISSGTPVEPNMSNIRLVSILLGILVPIGLIYLRDIFNDKVTVRTDITKNTNAPILGEVAHHKDKTRQLVVSGSDRSVLSEQFRIVRTNLQFLIKNNQHPVLMVTSSIPGEGKTFSSMNIAAVWAVAGKKTAILELDLRKPKITQSLGLKNPKGITSFIMGNATFEELPVQVEGTENLFLIPSGPIPPNPSEMLLDPKMEELFSWLRTNFDCIILDTAPVGLVSDSKILSRFTDVTIYLIRQGYTSKKQLGFVNDQYEEQNLPGMALLINDVKIGGANSYYGYGYGYGYGYNYGYQYGESGKATFWKRIKSTIGF